MRRLVARCENELRVPYGSDTWPAGLSDITLGLLIKRAGIRWKYCDLEHVGEIVWPPVCGVHLMQIARARTPSYQRFAIRHGLAHVLAGHVAEMSFARSDHDWRQDEEAVADVFAMMDLFSPGQLEEMRAAGHRIEHWIYQEMADNYAEYWPTERLADRVQLRRALC